MSEIIVSWSESLGAQRLNTIGADVHDERVHHGDVVVRAGLGRRLQIGAQLGKERDWRARLYVRVELEFELVWQVVRVRVGDFRRRGVDVGDHVYFEVGCERVREFHAAREG